MKHTLFGLVVTLFLSSASAAQTPDAPTIAAAERLLTGMDYDRQMERMSEMMAEQSGPAMKKSIEAETGMQVDDELIRKLAEVQRSSLREVFVNDKNLRRATALIYARHFSAADLDRLAILYKDPVMRKWTELAPALMGDMMPLIMDIARAQGAQISAKSKAIVTDYFAEKTKAGSS